MKELLKKLEDRLVTHLWDIARDLDGNDGFSCREQVEDVRESLSAICKLREIASHPNSL